MRDKQRFKEAETILTEATATYPENPVFRNALGTLYRTTGEREKAASSFRQAATLIALKNMRWRELPYIDPMMNLVRINLEDRSYEAAFLFASAAYQAVQADADDIEQVYGEIGWMFLYQGELSKAIRCLSKVQSGRSLDELGIFWMLQSCWLAEEIDHFADKLANGLLHEHPDWSDELVIATCLVAKYASRNLREKLVERIDSRHRSQVKSVEAEIGSSLVPMNEETEALVIRFIDCLTTGGRFNGDL